ncbi:hypothetical protein [Corynebacterium glyciniphilum]|uniref:hypothetical protein n=1 Tax=Corynebacterium glyciniphilum TaxID=1404244 RepID=UPI003FD3D94C
MTEFWAVAHTPVEDVEEYLPQITPTDRQSVVTVCLVLHSHRAYPPYKVVPCNRFTLPRLPGMAERITVFDWPSGPVDAPVPDRDTGSMMQFKFITPSLGIARAVEPEKRPLQAPPMFPGWGSSGPTAPWPPEWREGLAPVAAEAP